MSYDVPNIGTNELERIVRGLQKRPIEDTGWLTLSLVNSWAPWGGEWGSVARYRRLNGITWLQGLVTQPVAGQGAFTVAVLPAGFRPGISIMFYQVSGGRLDIQSSGPITFPSSGAVGTFCSITCTFPAEL